MSITTSNLLAVSKPASKTSRSSLHRIAAAEDLQELNEGSCEAILRYHQVSSVAFSPDGSLLAASNSDDSTVQLWGIPAA